MVPIRGIPKEALTALFLWKVGINPAHLLSDTFFFFAGGRVLGAAGPEKATALIQEEIAKLQTQLQQETQTVDEQKAATRAQLLATREAVARERQRFEKEIQQLSQVPLTFGESE